MPLRLSRILGILCLLAALPGSSLAGHVHGHRPKLALYVGGYGDLSQASRDTVAMYDLAVCMLPPSQVEEIRSKNPDIELFFQWMPQNIISWSENDTFWYPDTTWSILRLCEFYAARNDWFLRDTQGQRIPEWGNWAANWTRYCPKGTYGTSRGLNYVEWLMQVAIPQITQSGQPWAPWGPGHGSYDGFMLEVLVDCVGSWGYQPYEFADPDRDGEPEGVHAGCSMGGDQDSLSILYREMNDTFHATVSKLQDDGQLVLLNAGSSVMGPAWRTDVTGIKLEGWMSWYTRPWTDWWDNFYGLQDADDNVVWGPGWAWAEAYVGHHGIDALEGWDHSILHVRPNPEESDTAAVRLRRWGLGTSLLGDGYFTFTWDEGSVHWYPDYDRDMGEPVGDYFRRAVPHFGGGADDTLYVRYFTGGKVEVNPNPYRVDGIPAEDVRYGTWGPSAVERVQAVTAEPSEPVVTVPNPYRTGASIRVRGVRTRGVECAIYDLAGRLVRALPGAADDGNEIELRWDGRTPSGRKAAAGFYRLRIRTDIGVTERRFLFVPGVS